MATCGYEKPIKGKIPVVYFSRFDEKPLDEEDMREITRAARAVELRREIWFIAVNSNRGNGNYRVDIISRRIANTDSCEKANIFSFEAHASPTTSLSQKTRFAAR